MKQKSSVRSSRCSTIKPGREVSHEDLVALKGDRATKEAAKEDQKKRNYNRRRKNNMLEGICQQITVETTWDAEIPDSARARSYALGTDTMNVLVLDRCRSPVPQIWCFKISLDIPSLVMISSQPQRRRLYVLLDEVEKDILQKDDVVPSDLERVKEHFDRILEVIHMRCGQQLEATIARHTEPGSAGDVESTKETQPASRYEVRRRRPARRDSGITGTPSELGFAKDKEPLAEPLSKLAWVDTVADSLNRRRVEIEKHAKLPLDEQMKFDWTQDDARITHCLAGVPKGNEGHLRSLAARSLALQFEEWSCTRTISERTVGNATKNGDIPAFVNTLKVKQDDKKQVTTVIGAGRKMLLLERAFGCSAISAVLAFVWRSFYRARNEDIAQLGSELQSSWLSQYAKENQSRFDEGFHLYEGLSRITLVQQKLTSNRETAQEKASTFLLVLQRELCSQACSTE